MLTSSEPPQDGGPRSQKLDARYRRRWIPGATYFCTARLADRACDLLVAHIDLLRVAMRDARQSHPFTLGAMVVLPEHFHVLLTLPLDDLDCGERLAHVQAAFSEMLVLNSPSSAADKEPRRGPWEREKWMHRIRDDDDLDRHVAYIHWNPVLHGLVDSPSAWPHSSIHRYMANGLLPLDWGSAGIAVGRPGQFGERGD